MTGHAHGDVIAVPLVVLTCGRCGMDWQRVAVRGRPPRLCPSCKTTSGGRRIDTNTAGYRVALAVTNYRLAIEEAAAALRLGKNADALAALDRVQAPARTRRPKEKVA